MPTINPNEFDHTLAVIREIQPEAAPGRVDFERLAEGAANLEKSRAFASESWLERLDDALEADYRARARSGPTLLLLDDPKDDIERALRTLEAGHPERIGGVVDRFAVEHARRTDLEGHLGIRLEQWTEPLLRSALASRHPEHPEAAIASLAGRFDALGRFLRAGHGTARAALARELGPLNAGSGFYNPSRPIRADVTPYTQWDVPARNAGPRLRAVGHHADGRKPPIVLIHGHSSAMEEYSDLIRELGKRLGPDVPLVGIDFPGCGYSQVTGGQYTTRGYVSLLLEWLHDAGYRRFLPAGGSMGGNMSLQLARLGKDAGVIAAATWSAVGWGPMTSTLRWFTRLSQLAAKWDRWDSLFWCVYNIQKSTWYSEGWTGREKALRASDQFREEVYSRDYHRSYFGLVADQSSHSLRDQASHIRVPVLLMAGKDDHGPFQVHASAEALKGMIPECRWFDGFRFGGHSLANENAVTVAEKLAEFYLAEVH